MKLQKIGLTALFAILATLMVGDGQFIGHSQSQTSRGVALAQTTDERKAEADRLLLQGVEQVNNNQFEAALQSGQQALAISKEIGDRRREGYALGLVGSAYLGLKDLPRAIEYLQQSLAIARSINDSQLETIAQHNLSLAQSQSTPREADRLFQQGIQLFQQGIQQLQTSQFEAALRSLQQALIIYREIKNHRGEGNALASLGIAYSLLGDYGKAIEYQQQWLCQMRLQNL